MGPFTGDVHDNGNDIDTDACTAVCALAVCGDGLVEADIEACDDAGESVACDADCTLATCGDMTVNALAGEVCDDGNMEATDACVACQPAKCGDGFVQLGVEECDDGNLVDGDGCDATCKPTPMPPECLNAVMLTDANRSVNVINGGVACDSPFTTQWYRFGGAAGSRMPTTPPQINACGTHAPGWLSGSEPQINDGAVDRTICFNFSNNTCNWSEPAKVRNCGGYFVYYLKNVSWGCSGRYCGAP